MVAIATVMVAPVIAIVIAIQTIVIVIHIATTTNRKQSTDMKKTKNAERLIICAVCMIVIYCSVVFIIKEIDVIAITSVATALFAGVAVVWACISFKTQQDNIIRQYNLNAFTESIRLLMNSRYYNQGRDYINSDNFSQDIKLVGDVLKISSEEVGLDDFKKILDEGVRKKSGVDLNEEEEKRLRNSYERIRFFCMRMEYLGVLAENTADTFIVDYYGYTIKETYKRLESLIIKTQENPSTTELYKHYTQLYNLAIKRKHEEKLTYF